MNNSKFSQFTLFFSLIVLFSLLFSVPSVFASIKIIENHGLHSTTITQNQYYSFYTNVNSTCSLFIDDNLITKESTAKTSHQFFISLSDLKQGGNKINISCNSSNDTSSIIKQVSFQPQTSQTPDNNSNFLMSLFTPINAIIFVIILAAIMFIIYIVKSKKEKTKKFDDNKHVNHTLGSKPKKFRESIFGNRTKEKKKSQDNSLLFTSSTAKSRFHERIKKRNQVFGIFEKDLIDHINRGTVNQNQINRFLDQLNINDGVWLSIEQLKDYLLKSDKFWDEFTRLKIISKEKLKNWQFRDQVAVIKKIIFTRRLAEILENSTSSQRNPEDLVNKISILIKSIYTKSDFNLEFIIILFASLVKNNIIGLNNLNEIIKELLSSSYLTVEETNRVIAKISEIFRQR